jgi:hypothetical protein
LTKLARKWSPDIPLHPGMVLSGWRSPQQTHRRFKEANAGSLELSDLTIHGAYFEPTVGIKVIKSHELTLKILRFYESTLYDFDKLGFDSYKHTRVVILFTHHAKCLVRVYCDTFYSFYWSFNYVFISDTFNKLFNL